MGTKVAKWVSKFTCLANPEFRCLVDGASSSLDMAKRLHDIIEETLCRIANGLPLPVGESIAEQNISTTLDQRVCRTILVLVPAVRSPNLKLGYSSLDILDLGQQLVACKVAPVHCL